MESPPAASALSAWEHKLDSLGHAMCEQSTLEDWSEIDQLMRRYTELLHQPPAVDSARLAPAYRAAEAVVAELQRAAALARAATGNEVRRIGRGRKAVNAYR